MKYIRKQILCPPSRSRTYLPDLIRIVKDLHICFLSGVLPLHHRRMKRHRALPRIWEPCSPLLGCSIIAIMANHIQLSFKKVRLHPYVIEQIFSALLFQYVKELMPSWWQWPCCGCYIYNNVKKWKVLVGYQPTLSPYSLKRWISNANNK